jgi:hypothetical protein
MGNQGEFNFEQTGAPDGHAQWLTGRRLAAVELARRINLPIGHQVEVWLCGNIRLRGKLRLPEELLMVEEERLRHLELMVDYVPFTYREMESCVRLD